MKVKVSVVIPILNSIQYIEECINSILNQTLREIEILMVDAGSTDGTLEKLQEYERRDARCRIIHSEIKSCGYQNNMGVRNAVGEYIAFVESDDMIVPNMYEELWYDAKKYDVDYIKGDFETFYYLESGERISEKIRNLPQEFYNKLIDTSKHPDLLIYDIYLWKGIYKREFLLANSIWQNETKGAAFQDIGFMFQSIICAKRAMYTNKVYYQYRRDNYSSSVYNVNGYIFLKNEFLFIEQILKKKNIPSETWSYFYKRLSAMIQTRDSIMVFSGKKWINVKESLEELGGIFFRGIETGKFSEIDVGTQRYLEIIMLYKDADLYLHYITFKNKLKVKKWNSMLNLCRRHSHIVIFGCSTTNKRLFAILQRNGIAVSGFCDNAQDKWESTCCGVPVMKPDKVYKQYEDVVFLIPQKYGKAMCEQLKALGYLDVQMVVNDIGLDIASAFVYQYDKYDIL